MTALDRLALALTAASAALLAVGWQISRYEAGNRAICEGGTE